MRTTVRRKIFTTVVSGTAAAAMAVTMAACNQLPIGNGGDTGAAPDAATLKQRIVKASDGAPVVRGTFYNGGTSGGGFVSVLKGQSTERRMLDGSDPGASPNEAEPMGSMAADAVPVDQVATAREGVTCEQQGVDLTVTFAVTPTGKAWLQSECSQETQKQLLDGKAVPELSDPLSADALTTVLSEQKTSLGLTTFSQIVIFSDATEDGAMVTISGPGKTAAGECNLAMTRRFKVKGVTEGGVGRPGCESAGKETPFSLDGVTGEQLSSALAKGVKAAGGFKGATIHAGSNGIPVIDVLSDKQGGLARVDLKGNIVK